MIKRFNNKSGFTLIELMIVVAIIGILAAIAIPNFLTMQLRAKRSEVPLNLSGVATAEEAYFQEYGEYLSAAAHPAANGATKKNPWAAASSSGFTKLGWFPTGAVYGSYSVPSVGTTPPSFNASANCDVDGDGSNAVYTASNSARPAPTSASNVY